MSDDRGKLAAALAALDEIGAGWIVGVGTGSTTNLFIDALAGMRGHLGGAVASSVASARRLAAAGVRVLELNDVGRLPLYVDGADEATRRRELIKGGGGALTREKIVAAASERFVCIVDRSKLVERLGRFPLPVEIIAMAERHVTAELERLGGRAVRRPGFSSDNGNPILDVHGLSMQDPAELEARIETVAGVVCAGLFCRRPADLLIVGDDSGAERL